MIDVKETLKKSEERMEMAAMFLEEELNRVRAGRANVAILDGVRVELYGSKVPLNQVANVSVPDPRTIAIKPWDRKEIRNIEKAIMDSDVGITPENNGEIIRLNIPVPTEERRRDLVKQCNKICEKAKVEVRNVRGDVKDKLKKAIKDGLSEDNEKDAAPSSRTMASWLIVRSRATSASRASAPPTPSRSVTGSRFLIILSPISNPAVTTSSARASTSPNRATSWPPTSIRPSW